MVCLFLSQLLPITIFTSKKEKTAKDVLKRKDLAAGTPATGISSWSCFIYIPIFTSKKAKSQQSCHNAGIPATFYDMSGSQSAAMIFASENAQTAKDILNRKLFLLVQLQLLPLLMIFTNRKVKIDTCDRPSHYNFYKRKSENKLRQKRPTASAAAAVIASQSASTLAYLMIHVFLSQLLSSHYNFHKQKSKN